MPLPQHDHVVQALSPDRPDQPLYIRILPGRLVQCDDLLNPQGPDLPQKGVAVDPVPVAQQPVGLVVTGTAGSRRSCVTRAGG